LSRLCNDDDGDGFGVCPECDTINGCSFDGDDCNDTNVSIHPYAVENCTDLVDNDTNVSIHPYAVENCTDLVDNDCDAYEDCDDDDCIDDSACLGVPTLGIMQKIRNYFIGLIEKISRLFG
jgi:hypothetical protein